MPKKKPTIVTRIVHSKVSDSTKILQLFAVVMTNYRQKLGDEAWEAMRLVAGAEQTNAIAFLSWMLMGEFGCPKQEKWAQLLPKRK